MTILNKGDIAIIQYNSDGNPGLSTAGDGFTFVLLADVDASTVLHFTDAGFNTAGVIVNDTAVHEGTLTWTSGTALSAGTVVRIHDNIAGDSDNGYQTATGGGSVTAITGPVNGFASSGDQIFVYQGPVASTGQSPDLLFGANFGDDAPANPLLANGWNTNAPAFNGIAFDNSESQLPTALIGYEIGFNPEVDNAFYNGPTTGTPESLLAAIMNEANWITADFFQGDPPRIYSFSVAAPSAAPTLDTNTGSTVAEGGNDIILSTELEVNDTDTADSGLTFTLTSSVTNGTLYLDNDGSDTFTAGDTTLSVGSAFTQQNIADGDLQYAHNDSETTSDSFQFFATDGPNLIPVQTFSFGVTAVNDAPLVTGFGGDVSAYNELFGGPVAIETGGDVVITDADNADFNGGSLTVSFDTGLSEDQLLINNGGAVGIGFAAGGVFYNSVQFGTVSGGANGSDLVINFTSADATPSVIAELVEALRYDNTGGDDPTGGARTINLVLNDGDDNSSSVAATVNVTAVNDAPFLTSPLPTDLSFTEDTSQALVLGAGLVGDADSSFVTVRLQVDNGMFSIFGNASNEISIGGTLLEVNPFFGPSTEIMYTGALDDNGDNAATLTISAQDGDGSGWVTLGTVNLDIVAVDDLAVAVDDSFSVVETGVLTGGNLFAANPTTADSDVEMDAFSVIEVNGVAANVDSQFVLTSGALLTVNANGTFTYDTNGAFDGMALGAVSADSFTYTISGGDTANVAITVNGEDGDELFDGTSETGPFNGGPLGRDVASYVTSSAGVVADLTTPGNNTGDAVGDFYVGIEQLDGSNFNDTLSGTVGDDILEGWGGADRLVGLAGNDIYFVDDINDVIVETAGEGTADHVAVHQGSNYTLTAGADIELLTTANSGGTTSMNLIGNEIAQTIVGNNGSNLLGDGGGAGADVLRGSGGDDSYSIYNSDTDVIESNAGGGTDRIYAGRNYVLDDGVFVEEMSTTSRNATYSRNIEGNTSSQTIVGNEGKNVLGDGGGASSNGDVLIGGGGNDLYVVRNAGTTVIEAIGEGTFDRVSTSKDFTLTAGSEIESINTTSKLGTSNLRLTGNELAQTIQGNGGANWIDGGGGNDILLGEGGADTFVFSTALGAGNVDTIADFTSGEDMIFLDPAIFGLLPLGAFASNAAGVAGTADIRIIYNSTSGGLFYDADGDGADEAVKFAELQDSLTLTGADFFGGIPI